MVKRFFITMICLLMVTIVSAVGKRNDVLVVCPYPLSGVWSKNTLEPITELDKDKQQMDITYSVMRNSSFRNVAEMDAQEKTIFANYTKKRPNLIVIFGPGNYILAEDFNKKWAGVPMILVGELNYVCDKVYVCDSVAKKNVQRIPIKDFAKGKNLTFIYTPVYYNETIELMQKANPKMKQVLFLGGEEFVSREIEQGFEKSVRSKGMDFKAYHPDEATFHDLASLASTVDRRTSGFLYSNWHNKQGLRDKTLPADGIRQAMETLIPLFNTYNSIMDEESQTAGFVSYNHVDFISELKTSIFSILSKKLTAKQIPFIEIAKDKPVLNYEVLDRMGLNPESIRGDIEFVHVPKTLWQQYKVTFLVLVVLALTLLTMLFFYLYKRQKKLWDSSERYYALINNAPFNYNTSKLIFDENGNVKDLKTLSYNLALEQSKQRLNGEIGIKTLMESYPESIPEMIRQINEGRKQHKKAIRFTFELKEFNCYYEMLILQDNTDIIHTFSLNTTELMRTQQELKKAKDRAIESDRLKTAFVQNVSHEIRTPLNAVIGFSQLLVMPDDVVTPEEKQQYVGYIENNSEMLMMLINDILSIGDIERNQFPIEIGKVYCNNVCQKAMKTVEGRIPMGVKFYYTSEADDDFMIHSDEKRIQQVIINYLTNACKHTEKGEIHVHCSLRENPGKVTFSVTDTGTGVPKEMAETIFERFTKLDSFKQGVGLGLNICRTIATKLNGEVKLDTSYTDGARFVFIVPR